MKRRDSRTNQVQVDTKSRRMFLKSAGGFTLALPFLPSLLTAFSEKAFAANDTSLRYVNLLTPLGGLQHKNWLGNNLPSQVIPLYPGQNARLSPLANLVSSNGLSTVLDSRYQNLFPYMNLIAGLDAPVYWGHHRVASTGAFALHVDGYAPPSDQITMAGRIDVEFPTIDQILGYAGGNGIYGNTISGRRRHLNVSSGGFSPSWGRDDYFSASSSITPKDFVNTTSGAFNTLFGSIPQGQNQNSTNPLLNLVNEFWPSGKSLFRFLSGEDKQALDNLFQIAQQSANDYSGPMPYCPNATKPAGTTEGWNDDGSSMRALADIITLAFQCDVTRIVSFYAGDSVGTDWHSLSHAPSLQAPDLGQDGVVKIHQNISQNFFSYLGEKLRSTVDPLKTNSSILDNSLLSWTHEHKVAHDTLSMPTLLMGAAGGRINTGNFVDLRNRDKASKYSDVTGDAVYEGDIINRLWASVFYAMNIPRSAYEVQRGNNVMSLSLSKGYGHVLKNTDSWFPTTNYDLSQIGEPWDFLKKTSTTWG